MNEKKFYGADVVHFIQNKIMGKQLHLHAPWEKVKERLKETNLQLTDDDLIYEEGSEDALIERISNRIGSTR
ncbi:MAG: CsbD family protein [Chitinophagaceae bacterium]